MHKGRQIIEGNYNYYLLILCLAEFVPCCVFLLLFDNNIAYIIIGDKEPMITYLF